MQGFKLKQRNSKQVDYNEFTYNLFPIFINSISGVEALEMEAQLAKERVEALSEAFKSFDTDGDGSIGVDELKLGLQRVFKDFSITNEQAQNLISSFDKSEDGALQLDEFQGPEAIKLRYCEM